MPQLVEEVEALACCKAVWFALEIGSREIIFKGDTTAVIQVLEKGKKKKIVYYQFSLSIVNVGKCDNFILLPLLFLCNFHHLFLIVFMNIF